jgi:hypothetical protein
MKTISINLNSDNFSINRTDKPNSYLAIGRNYIMLFLGKDFEYKDLFIDSN